MSDLNRCEFIGRLGADPEIRRMGSGDPVVNLRLAVSDNWRDKNSGERKERTEWISVVIFNEQIAKVAEQYLKKGARIFVAGSMQTRKWEKDGVERYTTEIVLQKFRGELQMLDTPQTGAPARTKREEPAKAFADDLSDDLPF
jgi:single-strand DNA-binding protein